MTDRRTGRLTVVHLVRHGEVHNPDGVLYGRLPGFHLSELGRAMADRVAAHFAGHDVARVTASSLGKSWHPGCPVGPPHKDRRPTSPSRLRDRRRAPRERTRPRHPLSR